METAPNHAARVCAVVFVMRLAVGCGMWNMLMPSGSTRFIKRTGMMALTVILQALRMCVRCQRARI